MPIARQLMVISFTTSVLVFLKFATTGYSRLHTLCYQVCLTRKEMMEIMTWEVQTNGLKEVINKVISGSVERDVRKRARVSFS